MELMNLDLLTNREKQVFKLLGDVNSQVEIESIMGLTRKSVHFYRYMIKQKLGFRHQQHLLYSAIKYQFDN